MTDELLPCPFCGGEAETCSHYFEEGDMTLWQVRCKERPYDVEHPCYTADSFISFATEEEAVDAWNTRAAVTDEHFAIAVHNAEVWRKERTCRYEPTNRCTHVCTSCGREVETLHLGYNYCPNCGARVVE